MANYIVRTNAHRKKMADVLYNQGGVAITPLTQMSIGSGGKDINGDLIPPNGDMTNLRAPIMNLPITRYERVTDLEYILYASVNTDSNPGLIGVDVNEKGLVDADGIHAVIESFEGTGPLQPSTLYEYAIRAIIV